jgi:hypothetical protein
MSAVVIVLALAATAPAESPPVGATVVTGAVREVVAAGRTRAELKSDDGRTLVLRGFTPADDDELRRLSGAKIRARVQEKDPGLPATGGYVRVEHYEILEVGGGETPRIGLLAEITIGNERRLIFVDEQGTADLLPSGWTKKMSRHVGAKMWITGQRRGTTFQPLKHAILRTSSRPEAGQAEPEKKPSE